MHKLVGILKCKFSKCFHRQFINAVYDFFYVNDFSNRLCKRESVECNASKEWNLIILI